MIYFVVDRLDENYPKWPQDGCLRRTKLMKLFMCRARNNFRIVSGHDDRPNSFLLGHVSFLAGQMYMMNYSFRGP